MERIIEFTPAYNRRDPDPSKDYGIGGVKLRFLLKGNRGAVQFCLLTNWMLPEVQKERDERIPDRELPYWLHKPLPTDLGYHSLIARYDDQKVIDPHCPYLDGKPCYYDRSAFGADRIFEVLLREGDKGVWRELEKYYSEIFGT